MERNIQSDYHWHKAGNSRLLITIGESWTWGESLPRNQRHNLVYGKQLADKLCADWLNIAECGQSNLWISDHYQEVIQQIPEWGYQQVDIVLTMTEVGREFNGDRDADRTYTDLLQSVTTPDQLFDILSELVVQKIQPGLSLYPTWIGTNFVDSNYQGIPILPHSWLDLIAEANGQTKRQDRTLVVGSWVYERFDAVFEFKPTIDRSAWRMSMIDHMSRADHVTQLLSDSPLNYTKECKHPTSQGHALWANYLYKKITS